MWIKFISWQSRRVDYRRADAQPSSINNILRRKHLRPMALTRVRMPASYKKETGAGDWEPTEIVQPPTFLSAPWSSRPRCSSGSGCPRCWWTCRSAATAGSPGRGQFQCKETFLGWRTYDRLFSITGQITWLPNGSGVSSHKHPCLTNAEIRVLKVFKSNIVHLYKISHLSKSLRCLSVTNIL